MSLWAVWMSKWYSGNRDWRQLKLLLRGSNSPCVNIWFHIFLPKNHLKQYYVTETNKKQILHIKIFTLQSLLSRCICKSSCMKCPFTQHLPTHECDIFYQFNFNGMVLGITLVLLDYVWKSRGKKCNLFTLYSIYKYWIMYFLLYNILLNGY